jgi:DNA-binding winged helix-turn-helix (wHTH) protein
MTALPQKIALRRMLQSYIGRLDDAIVELMANDNELPTSCQFYEDSIISWQNKQHVFSPSTYNLLKHFFDAPKMMLSKEDIRQDVLQDEEAREGSIRQCILEARKEIKRCRFPYRIETIVRKGYRLVAED